MGCKNCKDNIVSQTKSLIADPKCNPACPETIVCQDLIPSSCIFYSGSNLPCLGVNNTDRLTDVIKAINTKLYTITSDNIVITQSVVDGCTVLNLEAPSGQVNVDEKVSATIGGATDIPGFLADKLSSSDGSIAINTINPEVSTVNLVAPCATKVKVSDVSQGETCGYLVDKFSEGAVLPEVDYLTDPNNPTIRFIRQIRTYHCAPQSISFVDNCNPAINSGTIVNPPVTVNNYNWQVTADTMQNPGDITFNIGTGEFTVVRGGIYDINIAFGVPLTSSPSLAPGYIRVLLHYIGANSGLCITYATIYCTTQTAVYANAIVKGVSIPNNTSFDVLLYNYSGLSTQQQYSNIDLSFEKVG